MRSKIGEDRWSQLKIIALERPSGVDGSLFFDAVAEAQHWREAYEAQRSLYAEEPLANIERVASQLLDAANNLSIVAGSVFNPTVKEQQLRMLCLLSLSPLGDDGWARVPNVWIEGAKRAVEGVRMRFMNGKAGVEHDWQNETEEQ